MTNRTITVALLFLCSTLFSGCIMGYLPPKTTYKDEYVEVFRRDPFALPHFASDAHYAKIGNVRFHNVKRKMGEPCYIWLEKGRKLLLMTQYYRDEETRVWVVSFDTKIVQVGVLKNANKYQRFNNFEDSIAHGGNEEIVLDAGSGTKPPTLRYQGWFAELKFYAYLRKNDNGSFAL